MMEFEIQSLMKFLELHCIASSGDLTRDCREDHILDQGHTCQDIRYIDCPCKTQSDTISHKDPDYWLDCHYVHTPLELDMRL